MHRRAELEGNLRRKPNPKGAQAGARKRSEESDEAIVAGKRGNACGYPPSDSESRSDALAGVRMASACKMDDANQMARTIMSNPNHPQSPQQRYCLTLVTISAIL